MFCTYTVIIPGNMRNYPMICTYLPSNTPIKVQNTPFLPFRCSCCAFEGRKGGFLPLDWDVIPY